MVVDGVTGVLVPPGDAPALARGHCLGAERSTSRGRAFGAAGRNRAREFTVSAVVERIERMYAGAIAQTKAEASSGG